MTVTMVNVWVVWMAVCHFHVTVQVRMWFTRRITRTMRVLMMLVVSMQVFMLHLFVPMLMLVTLCQMQPNSRTHQYRRHTEAESEFVTQEQYGDARRQRSCVEPLFVSMIASSAFCQVRVETPESVPAR